uniref:Translation initiation factor eIF2B subunit beta n=1 Tax=Aegilops tauschii subsp. strangulata TaxID=200361 RepID=A0A452Y9J6_AEGTS
ETLSPLSLLSRRSDPKSERLCLPVQAARHYAGHAAAHQRLRPQAQATVSSCPRRPIPCRVGAALVCSLFVCLWVGSKVEGSHAVARQTAELLRSVVSQHRMGSTNQAAALADAIHAVGEHLIAANPIELAVGNTVRRVLHIIKEEDISFTAVGIEGLSVTAVSDDECDSGNDDRPTLSAAVLASHARNALRAPSLQTLLDDIPVSTALSHSSSSAGDSDGKTGDKSLKTRKLKHDVIAAIGDLIEEIDTCYDQISEQAVEHIH